MTVLVLLFSLGGCVAAPFGQPSVQEQPASIVLENSANQTQTFEISIVEVGAHITIQRNGTTDNITVSEGSFTFISSEVPISTVTLSDSARIQARYTLEPGEKTNTTVEKLPRDSAVVITIYDEENGAFRAIKSVNCGGADLIGYAVTTQPGHNDVVSAFECV